MILSRRAVLSSGAIALLPQISLGEPWKTIPAAKVTEPNNVRSCVIWPLETDFPPPYTWVKGRSLYESDSPWDDIPETWVIRVWPNWMPVDTPNHIAHWEWQREGVNHRNAWFVIKEWRYD